MTGRGDGPRLALSFLTVLPVRAGRVDAGAAGQAMLLAPLVGVALGLAAGALAEAGRATGMPAELGAALAVAALAGLTRGLHLDGLADTADGLGSGRGAQPALQVMRRSDVGPFGVATLALTLLIQVAALAELVRVGAAVPGLVTAAATGRAAVTLSCRRGVPAARGEGLGALVAGTVPPAGGGTVAGLVLVLAVVAATLTGGSPVRAGAAVVAGLLAAHLLQRHAVRRLGGITGDVLGALVEIGTTGALVVLATG